MKLMSVISMECTCLHHQHFHCLRQCLPLFVLRERNESHRSPSCFVCLRGGEFLPLFFLPEPREGRERMRFINELLSSPHIIVADGDTSSLVNLSLPPLPQDVYGDFYSEWGGGIGETTALLVLFCHRAIKVDGLSSVSSFFLPTTPHLNTFPTYIISHPPPLLHLFIFFSPLLHQKRTPTSHTSQIIHTTILFLSQHQPQDN